MRLYRFPYLGLLTLLCLGLLMLPHLSRAQSDQFVYDEALVNGWQNWSWCSVDFNSPDISQTFINTADTSFTQVFSPYSVTLISLAPAPQIPTGLTATPGDTTVSLAWSPAANATGYKVKRSTTAGGPYSVVGSPSAASYMDTGRTNGVKYYYVVSATNSFGESGKSNEVNATPNASSNSAVFVKVDTTTQGSWKTFYGTEGYSIL